MPRMHVAGGRSGINLAIQDAVATANLLADALRERQTTEELLQFVQRPSRISYADDSGGASECARSVCSTVPQHRSSESALAVESSCADTRDYPCDGSCGGNRR